MLQPAPREVRKHATETVTPQLSARVLRRGRGIPPREAQHVKNADVGRSKELGTCASYDHLGDFT